MEGVRFIPCKICSAPSTGFHFGALTCEACKAFFRRVLKSGATLDTLTCSGTDPSPGDGTSPSKPSGDGEEVAKGSQEEQGSSKRCDLAFNPKKCPKCRYSRCLEVGMGPSASKIGRPTKHRVAEVREELHRLKPWLDVKSSLKDAADDNTSASSGDLFSKSHLAMDPRGSRKRTVDGNGVGKKRYPSMPAGVFGASGISNPSQTDFHANLQAHVRHYSGDVFDSRYTYHYIPSDDFDDDDDNDDDGDLYPEQKHDNLKKSSLVGLSGSASAINGSTSSPPLSQPRQLGAGYPNASPSANSEPPLAVIVTVIQQYNASGGNRQRFVQSLRDLGADREGSSLGWLYQSADQWFDLANVMFQSPLAVSNLLSTAQSQAQPHQPSNAPNFNSPLSNPERDSFKLLSQLTTPPPAPTSTPVQSAMSSAFSHIFPQLDPSATSPQPSQPTTSPLLGASVFSPWPQAVRSETMARQVVQATKHLASLNLSRHGLRPGSISASAHDVWALLMENFETNTAHISSFARGIPGFSMLQSAADRALLSANAFYPLLFANMSIEFDPITENIRLYWANGRKDDNGTHTSPIEVSGNSKMNTLSVVEFGFLCSLIYFNPSIGGLQDPISVEMVSTELMTSVEYFIKANYPNISAPPTFAAAVGFSPAFLPTSLNGSTQSRASLRLSSFQQLVAHFRGLNPSNSWIYPEVKSASSQQTNSNTELNRNPNEAKVSHNSSQVSQSDFEQDSSALRDIYQKMFELMNSQTDQTMSYSPSTVTLPPPSASNNILQQMLLSHMRQGESLPAPSEGTFGT